MNIGDIRFEFLMESVRNLDANLKKIGCECGLLFLIGEPDKLLPRICKTLDINGVYFDDSEENEVHDRKRDESICMSLRKVGIKEVSLIQQHTIIPMDTYEAKLKGGSIPLTMGSFQKLFNSIPKLKPIPAPDAVPYDAKTAEKLLQKLLLATDASPEMSLKSSAGSHIVFPVPTSEADYEQFGRVFVDRGTIKYKGGEDEALERLTRFTVEKREWLASFEKPKTAPNSLEPSTTVLSPYFTHGCLSASFAYHAVAEVIADLKKSGKKLPYSQPPVSMLGQFLWREHWYTIGRFTPHDISKMVGNPLSRQIPWDDIVSDAAAAERLAAWEEGRTGYPFIDAIMHQLKAEGWVHHLARHMVACFLTRGDLWISWEHGARVFDSKFRCCRKKNQKYNNFLYFCLYTTFMFWPKLYRELN